MPQVEFLSRRDFTYGENGAVLKNGCAVLRRLDSSGIYHPQGTLTEEIFQSEWVNVNLLENFFGFICSRADSLTGGVDFQISANGSDFLSWDGAAWSVDSARWSTFTEVEENIGLFPVGYSPTVAVRMRLQPVGDETPMVYRLAFLVEMCSNSTHYGFEEDVERTIKYILDSRISVPVRDKILANGTTEVPVPSSLPTISSVTGVYDVVSDPDLQTNLFSGLSGSTITLTSAVASGTELYVLGEGKPPVKLSGEPEYEEAKIPNIYIENISLSEDLRFKRPKLFEVNLAKKVARKRWSPARQEITVMLRCASARRKITTRIADAVKVAILRDATFRALGSGRFLVIRSVTPITNSDRISDSMHERLVSVTLVGWDYTDFAGYEEVPLTENVLGGYGTLSTRLGIVEVQG